MAIHSRSPFGEAVDIRSLMERVAVADGLASEGMFESSPFGRQTIEVGRRW
jgi:hypothetical protein